MTTSQDFARASGDSAARPGNALERFSAPARRWFEAAFAAPTAAQDQAWQAISEGGDALVVAPTGSGKTLAAFLWALDTLAGSPKETREPGVKVLYVSPLKALGVDVERNLRAPLAGLREAAVSLGVDPPDITVGVRSGDTTPAERRRLVANPPDILITTPESLYLMLTSAARETLQGVRTVIVDEVHALAGNKRGAHLALSLERLDAQLQAPAQRIGLSATVEPAAEVARFLGGTQAVKVVRPPAEKKFDITVEVPVEDMTNIPAPEPDMVNANSSEGEHRLGSMWPAIENSLYERIMGARSTIVFANSRRLAERLTARLNQIHEEQQAGTSASERPTYDRGGPLESAEAAVLARAHHGSVAKDVRAQVEEDLKSGRLRCVVATASLELGIDMGEVDLVVQIDPPPSVASGLQRLGRSGHQVGAASRAVFYPTHRSKLLETATVVERMHAGEIETLRMTTNPLDVLAQQTIAHAVQGPLDVDDWYHAVRRAAPFSNLPRSAYTAVLELISGKYPSTEFAALRARLDWDRDANTLTARPGAQRLAVTSGGTIPDRGLYRVVTPAADQPGTRVGELDEEMVYETRVGEVFTLGTTPWRVREITKDTVEVEPAFGVVAKTPFWRGDSPSRPSQLGRALGELTGALATEKPERATARLRGIGFDQFAATNTLQYVREQVETGGHLPTQRTLVVEKTRDEVGDWLYILHSPWGLAVHLPWALAIDARLRDRWGLEGKAVPSNDGIIVRLPDFDDGEAGESDAPGAADVFLFSPAEMEETVRAEAENSAVFASRFREAAARALILGSSKPGKRSPLWQQRLRAGALLEVARRYPDFPMILEALREVLQDVYDTDALRQIMAALESRQMTLVEVSASAPSPFARSLLFGYVGEFVYAGDTPAGERRLAALSVDPEVLRELLGEIPLSELLEPEAIEDVEAELQRTKPGWQARGTTGLVDLLRELGPLTGEEITTRMEPPQDAGPGPLSAALSSRQVFPVRLGGGDYYAAAEDAGLLIAAAGAIVPAGLPAALLEAPAGPVRQLLVRHLQSNGPFTAAEVAERFGLAPATVSAGLRELQDAGQATEGAFLPAKLAGRRGLPDGQAQWVGRQVLDRMRTRSLMLLRGSVEPVSAPTFAEFLTRWQYCAGALSGVDGVFTVIEQLSGLALPASTWETLILPQRVSDYRPEMLDQLVTAGEVTWVAAGALGSRDGWVAFYPAGAEPSHPLGADRQKAPLERGILETLTERGALFAPALQAEVSGRGETASAREFAEAMWALVWDGLITADTLGPLRARTRGRRAAQKTVRTRPRGRTLTRRSLAATTALAAPPAADPTLVGRWSLVEDTGRSSAAEDVSNALRAIEMLDRYGVVTRGAVTAEDFPGGFAAAYRLYAELESSGACRRGYSVEGLGGAQFAVPGAVDRLRELQEQREKASRPPLDAVTLAATDPANPYGAALAWPETLAKKLSPKRKAGALVTLVDGLPVLYVERGGKTILTDEESTPEVRAAAAQSLVATARRADLATFTIEKANGGPVRESAWAQDLRAAGFGELPRGLTLRRKLR